MKGENVCYDPLCKIHNRVPLAQVSMMQWEKITKQRDDFRRALEQRIGEVDALRQELAECLEGWRKDCVENRALKRKLAVYEPDPTHH